MRAERGQGTVEWVAIVAVVSLLIAAGGALADVPYVGRAVTRQYARALCIVGHGDCDRDREPCVVRTDRHTSGWSLSAFVIDIGKGREALVEKMSDGTFVITRIDNARVAAEMKLKFSADVQVGGRGVGVGAELGHALSTAAGGGSSWVVRGEGEARELLARLERGDDTGAPAITYGRLEMDRSTGASARAGGRRGAELTGALSAGRRVGKRIDHRRGRTTIYLDAEANESLGLLAGGRRLLESSHGAGGKESYAIEIDPAGRMIALQVVSISSAPPELARSAPLPAAAPRKDTADRRYELTASLDLTDPVNSSATRALVRALERARAQELAVAARRVATLVERQATLELRVLDGGGDEKGTVGAAVTVAGVKAGAGRERARQVTRLVAASSRGLDGAWLPRDDCTAAGRRA